MRLPGGESNVSVMGTRRRENGGDGTTSRCVAQKTVVMHQKMGKHLALCVAHGTSLGLGSMAVAATANTGRRSACSIMSMTP
jgi:hypothetical protein